MDQKTIDTYNTMAIEYDDETIDFWERFPRTFLDKFIDLNPKATVLDVGAGPGRDGVLLQQSGLTVTCLDASKEMVDLSTAKGLKSIVGDFMDMPFEDASFDAVWAYTSLLHIPKKQINEAIQEIKRVLKPNGYIGLGMIEGDTEGYRNSSGVNKPRWFSFYTKQEIEELLKQHKISMLYLETFQPGSKKYLNIIAQK